MKASALTHRLTTITAIAALSALGSGCAGLSLRVTDTPSILGRFVTAGETITLTVDVKNVAGCDLTGFQNSPYIAFVVFPFVGISEDLNLVCSGQIAPDLYARAQSSRDAITGQFEVFSQSMVQLADASMLCLPIPDSSLPSQFQQTGAMECIIPVPVPFPSGASAQGTVVVTAPRSGVFRSLVFAGAQAIAPYNQCVPVVQTQNGGAGGFACDQVAQLAPAVSAPGLTLLVMVLTAVGLLAVRRLARRS